MIWHGTIRPHKWCWLLGALLAFDGAVAYQWLSNHREKNHDRRIRNAAQRYQVDPALVKAIVWRESRFNPAAKGKAGEIGFPMTRYYVVSVMERRRIYKKVSNSVPHLLPYWTQSESRVRPESLASLRVKDPRDGSDENHGNRG